MMEPTSTTAFSSLRSIRDTKLDNETDEDHRGNHEKQSASTNLQFFSLLAPTLPPPLATAIETEPQEQQLKLSGDEDKKADDEEEEDGTSATALHLTWSHHEDDDHEDDPELRMFHAEDEKSKTARADAKGSNQSQNKIMFCLFEDTTTTATAATTTSTTATESSNSQVLYSEESDDCLKNTTQEGKEKSVSFIDWIIPSHSFCSALSVLDDVWEEGTSATTSATTTEAVGDEAVAKAHTLQELREVIADSSLTAATATPAPRGTLRRNSSKRTSFRLPPRKSLPSFLHLSSSSFRQLSRDVSSRGSEFGAWDSIALSQGDCAWDLEGDDSPDACLVPSSEPATSTFVTNRGVRRSAFIGAGSVPCSRVNIHPRDLSWSDNGRVVATQATRRHYWW